MLSKLLLILLLSVLSLQADWSEYKRLFIANDGRVIDKANGGITHSESIGYAMYLALENRDLVTFSKVDTWQKNNLGRNKFGLVPWKWGKDSLGVWHILDTNNASDGDLWIAYDYLLMYEITKNREYKNTALELMKSIQEHLLVKKAGSVYLLPGKDGFEKKESLELNLSYYLFFIFEKFSKYDKNGGWMKLRDDGITLLKRSRFGSMALPADWILYNKYTQEVHPSKNRAFGYDAIRIPFNILKSDIQEKKSLLTPYKNYVNAMKSAETIFGICSFADKSISLQNYSYGHLSIYNMIDKYFNKSESFSKKLYSLKEKHKDDYYSYSLYLFTTAR